MRRLLVTGGAGFIGSNFVHHWLGQYPNTTIVVLDALTYAGNRANLDPIAGHPGFQFVHGNIGDQALVEKLLVENRLDTVVHFAAESHVDRSIHGPDAFVETNIIGTHSLLKAARNIWLDTPVTANPAHRFHHVSTDEVFGSLGPNDPAFREDTSYAPNSPYSATKAASDHLVRAYHHTYGLNTTMSNCSNNYGPYHFPEKLIPLCIVNALKGNPIPVYGNGQNIRDWLYVEDHCRGIELVLNKGRLGETYNLGGKNEQRNLDLVHTLCASVDQFFLENSALAQQYPECPAARGEPCSSLITFVADRPGHDVRYAVDTAKAESELSYAPRESYVTGLRKTVGWYLQNNSWWLAVLNGDYRNWLKRNYGEELG